RPTGPRPHRQPPARRPSNHAADWILKRLQASRRLPRPTLRVHCTKINRAGCPVIRSASRSGSGTLPVLLLLRRGLRLALDAFRLFLADDGWAIASHIALSTLMAFFPFLIVLTALAGFFGSKELADQAAQIMLAAWPAEV